MALKPFICRRSKFGANQQPALPIIPAAGVRLSESLATSHETRAAEARTLSRHWSAEAGIPTETLQMFLARNAGVAEGRLTKKGAREMRAAFAKTILVVDEGSLASTVQARDLLRIAAELRMPRVVLVGDAKQLDAVDAGKPFAQLQAAGMQTATMDEIMRQRDPVLREAVVASLKGDIEKAFEKLGSNVAEVKPDNIAGAVAARWLSLSEEARANTGVMAPSHELRQAINGHIRERLAREGRIHGPPRSACRSGRAGSRCSGLAKAGRCGRSAAPAIASRPSERRGTGRLPVPDEAPDGGRGMSDDTRHGASESGAAAAEFVRETVLARAEPGKPGIGRAGPVAHATDRADVPLQLVPRDGETGRDGPRRAQERGRRPGRGGQGLPRFAALRHRRLSRTGAGAYHSMWACWPR